LGSEQSQDFVIEEQAIAFVYNGISHAVMMATPVDLADFALGFSLSEGIINYKNDLLDLEIEENELGVELNITISNRHFNVLKQKRRTLAGNSGCGLCGLESLQQISNKQQTSLATTPLMNFSIIETALNKFRDKQILNIQAGGVHAAAFCDIKTGNILLIREDVGRHNALDKLIGAIQNNESIPQSGFIISSSRASYEMVDKTITAGVNHLVTISAPTSKAIELAKKHHLNLIGFAREDRQVIYNESENHISL
jgi:FdhD protein